MHIRLVFATAFVALTLGLTPTIINVPMASADHDPRSDRACETWYTWKENRMLELNLILHFLIATQDHEMHSKVPLKHWAIVTIPNLFFLKNLKTRF